MPDKNEDYDYDDLEAMLVEDQLKRAREGDPQYAPRRDDLEKWSAENELRSPMAPMEYDAAYRSNAVPAAEPMPPMQGAGLTAQNFADDMKFASTQPQEEDVYPWSHTDKDYLYPRSVQEPETPQPMTAQGDDTMDFGRGSAFTDMVGNSFYSPHMGPRAGEPMSLPEGIQGDDFEAYMADAEMPGDANDTGMASLRDARIVPGASPDLQITPTPEEAQPMIAPEDDPRFPFRGR